MQCTSCFPHRVVLLFIKENGGILQCSLRADEMGAAELSWNVMRVIKFDIVCHFLWLTSGTRKSWKILKYKYLCPYFTMMVHINYWILKICLLWFCYRFQSTVVAFDWQLSEVCEFRNFQVIQTVRLGLILLSFFRFIKTSIHLFLFLRELAFFQTNASTSRKGKFHTGRPESWFKRFAQFSVIHRNSAVAAASFYCPHLQW